MMMLKSYILAILAILPSLTYAAPCRNSRTFRKFISGDYRSCSWIRFNEKRRVKHCVDPDVLDACPQTCGTCCDDDPTFQFDNFFDVMVDCNWIVKNLKKVDKRRDTWCQFDVDGDNFENDVNVRDGKCCL